MGVFAEEVNKDQMPWLRQCVSGTEEALSKCPVMFVRQNSENNPVLSKTITHLYRLLASTGRVKARNAVKRRAGPSPVIP